MSDIQCPYCNTGQEICHDEGYGYEEDTTHEQECHECGRYFNFTTYISFHYTAHCQGDHDMGEWEPIPVDEYFKARRECLRENCEHYEFQRNPHAAAPRSNGQPKVP
jgi:hypothetical protein